MLAMKSALGIAVGSLIWMIAAAMGVSIVLEAIPMLGQFLKVAGGLYLIFLGIKLIRSKGILVSEMHKRPEGLLMRGFARGLVVNLTSPKSAAYFGSIFAAFLTDQIEIWVLAAFILCLFLVSILWHVFLALAFSWDFVRKPYRHFSSVINHVAGGFLVLFGFRLIFDTR